MSLHLILKIVHCVLRPSSSQVDDDANAEEIKRAYRALAKECHPDYKGDEGHNICILLNEAYEVGTLVAVLACENATAAPFHSSTSILQ